MPFALKLLTDWQGSYIQQIAKLRNPTRQLPVVLRQRTTPVESPLSSLKSTSLLAQLIPLPRILETKP